MSNRSEQLNCQLPQRPCQIKSAAEPSVAVTAISNDVIESAKQIYGSMLERIILYGSYARGDFSHESDMDFMILLDCVEEDLRSFRRDASRMASRIGLHNDIEVSVYVQSRHHFEQRLAILPFYRNVQREGIIIYG